MMSSISRTECGLLDDSYFLEQKADNSVHGGAHKEGIVITKEHSEGLTEMDKLSEFAPLHVRCSDTESPTRAAADIQNHHAVLAVRSCLEALPKHTSILLFDTLFHVSLGKTGDAESLYPANYPKGDIHVCHSPVGNRFTDGDQEVRFPRSIVRFYRDFLGKTPRQARRQDQYCRCPPWKWSQQLLHQEWQIY
jgi:hypothetical protein